MVAKASKTEGAKLYIGTTAENGASDTYTQIKRVTSIGEVGPETSAIDVTALEDYAREKIKGMRDHGDVEIEISRITSDPGQAALKAAADDDGDLPYNFRIEFDDQITPVTGNKTKIEFKAHVLAFRIAPVQVNGVVKVKSRLAITGETTETLAA